MFYAKTPATLKQSLDAVLLPAFVVDCTPDGFKLAAINDSHEAISGLSNEDVQNLSPAEILKASDAHDVEAHYTACVESQAPIQYAETLDMPHGRINWLTSLIPLCDADGQVTRILGNSVGALEEGQSGDDTKCALIGDMTQLSLMSAIPLNKAINAINERLESNAENVDDRLLLRALLEFCGTALDASHRMRRRIAAHHDPIELEALLKGDALKPLIDKLDP